MLPLHPRISELTAVARALLACDRPVRLRVALKPTRLLPWEQAAMVAASAGDATTWIGSSGHGTDPAGPGGHGSDFDPHSTLVRSADRLFLARIVVEAAGGATPWSVVSAVVAELSGEAGVPCAGFVATEQLPIASSETDGGDDAPLLARHADDPAAMARDPARRLRLLFPVSEAARLFRLPTPFEPLPGFLGASSRRLRAPACVPTAGLVLGRDGRGAGAREVAVSDEARSRHLYVCGQSGTGKSVLLHRLILQDINAGRGVCVVDPHGDLVEAVLGNMPAHRIDDVIVLDPTDLEHPVGLNLLDCVDRADQDRTAEEFLALVTRLWPPEYTGPVFQYNVRNTLLLMMHLAQNGTVPAPASILGLPRYVRDTKLLRAIRKHVTDTVLLEFIDDVLETSDFHRSELRGYLVSKFNVLIGHHGARLMVGQRQSQLDIRRVVDEGKVLLVRLPSGELGEVAARFLGFLVLLKIQNAILARAALPPERRHPFSVFIDEFQNFLTESLPILLAEGRKFGVNLVLANQFLGQLLDEKNRRRLPEAIFGNVGTIVSFRVGSEDAVELARQLGPPLRPNDLIRQPNFEALARILVRGAAPPIVSIRSEPWPTPPDPALAARVRHSSQHRYGRPVEHVRRDMREEVEALKKRAGGGE